MSASRTLVALTVALLAACSGGSDAGAPTTSAETIAQRFDEEDVVGAITELVAETTTRGLIPRGVDLYFHGCGNNEADERVFGGQPKFFYRVDAAVDAPIGPGAVPLDVERIGAEVAGVTGWSAPNDRGVHERKELSMRYTTWGPRLVIEVSGPCLEAIDAEAADDHSLGAGRQTLKLPGTVQVTDEPLAIGDGIYLPASDPETRVPGG